MDIRTYRARRGGFTLVELLVVVAILAILVAILSPTLVRTRQLARISVCASNQHQIVSTTLTYATANRAYFPVTHRRGAGSSGDDHISWTSPKVYQYYEKTDMDMLSFACPNRGDNYVKYQASNNTYRMGYYLMFGRDDKVPNNGPQVPWYPPRKVGDNKEGGVMTGDIIEKGTWHTQWGRFVSSSSHGRRGVVHGVPGGFEEPEQFGSEGGNVGFVNGSVLWTPQAEMVENKVSTGGTVTGYW